MGADRPPVVFVPPAARSRAALALGCHGNPDRCIVLGTRRMAICARCAGLVAGNAVAAVAALASGLPGIWLALALLAPLAIDGSLQATTSYRSSNPRRLLTGIAAGIGQFSIAIAVFAGMARVG